MEKIITQKEWEERFHPFDLGDEEDRGYSLIDLDDLPPDADPSLVWTQVSVDDYETGRPGWAIMSGLHRVNREGYYLCRVPVADDEEYVVETEWDEEWEPESP